MCKGVSPPSYIKWGNCADLPRVLPRGACAVFRRCFSRGFFSWDAASAAQLPAVNRHRPLAFRLSLRASQKARGRRRPRRAIFAPRFFAAQGGLRPPSPPALAAEGLGSRGAPFGLSLLSEQSVKESGPSRSHGQEKTPRASPGGFF